MRRACGAGSYTLHGRSRCIERRSGFTRDHQDGNHVVWYQTVFHNTHRLCHAPSSVPGVVLHIGDGNRGETLVAGRSSLAGTSSMRENDRFRIGSITKSYLSVVMLQLVAESRASLDDSVERWVPGVIANGNAITIRQLLNHTSGLFDYFHDAQVLLPYLSGDFAFAWAPRQLLAIANARGPVSAPGVTQQYSNSNYTLLGLVIEAVAGHSLAQVLQTRLYTPLGLSRTTLAVDASPDASRARGYLLGDDTPLDVTDLYPFYWGAGNVVSDAADVARFYSALMRGQLLTPAQLAVMKAPPAGASSNYGLGIMRTAMPCGDMFGHGGATPGYSASAWAFNSGRVVVALANSLTFDDHLAPNPAAEALWNRMLLTAACG